jgi:hypothetical protein
VLLHYLRRPIPTHRALLLSGLGRDQTLSKMEMAKRPAARLRPRWASAAAAGRRAKSGGGSGHQLRQDSEDEVVLRALVRADRHPFCPTIMFSISLTNRAAPTSLPEQEIAAFAKPRPRGRKRSMRRTSRHRNRPAVWDTLAASAPRPRARAPQFQNVFVEEVQTGRN